LTKTYHGSRITGQMPFGAEIHFSDKRVLSGLGHGLVNDPIKPK
jgi:hypothetical protein